MSQARRGKVVDLSNEVGALVIEQLAAKDVSVSEAIAVLLANLSALIGALPEANRLTVVQTVLDDLPKRVQRCAEKPAFTFVFPNSQPKG